MHAVRWESSVDIAIVRQHPGRACAVRQADQEIAMLTGQINARREQQKMQVSQATQQQASRRGPHVCVCVCVCAVVASRSCQVWGVRGWQRHCRGW